MVGFDEQRPPPSPDTDAAVGVVPAWRDRDARNRLVRRDRQRALDPGRRLRQRRYCHDVPTAHCIPPRNHGRCGWDAGGRTTAEDSHRRQRVRHRRHLNHCRGQNSDAARRGRGREDAPRGWRLENPSADTRSRRRVVPRQLPNLEPWKDASPHRVSRRQLRVQVVPRHMTPKRA